MKVSSREDAFFGPIEQQLGLVISEKHKKNSKSREAGKKEKIYSSIHNTFT